MKLLLPQHAHTRRSDRPKAPRSGAFSFLILETMNRSLARLRYVQHKRNAAKRGIEWEFTFEEWCAVWEPHWADRGPRKDQKVMCRTHDAGPYRPDNVRIDSPKGNAAERGLMLKCSRTYWWQKQGPDVTDRGFKSYGNLFLRPEVALEVGRNEREWIPGE